MGENGVILGTMEEPDAIQQALDELEHPSIGGPSRSSRRIEAWTQKKCQKAARQLVLGWAILTVFLFVATWLGNTRDSDTPSRQSWHEAWNLVTAGMGSVLFVAAIAVLGFAGWKVLKKKLKKHDHQKDTENNAD